MTVLVTAIGSMSALCVLRNLKNIENIKIIGTDIYPVSWQANLDFLERFYTIPKSADNNYIDTVMEICVLNNVTYILPLTDPEVDVLNENRDVFINNGIVICISPYETILTCRDKTRINSNIPVITYDDLYNKTVYPIIAKPKKGRSSEGKFLLENPSQLAIINNITDYIFQPYINGVIVTADIIRDKSGNTVYIARKELIRTSNGAGIVVDIFEDILLNSIIYRIADELGVLGCINIEFIYSKDTYYLMDVNPRFSAGVGFSCCAGYDFVTEHLNVFLNRDISELKGINAGIYTKRSEVIKTEGLYET